MGQVRGFLARLALFFSLALPIYFLIAAFGVKFGYLDWRVGYSLMTLRLGPVLLFAAAILALAALIMAMSVAPRRGRRIALVALILPLVGIGYATSFSGQFVQAAPLPDVSTDVSEPPAFSPDVLSARAAAPAANGLDLVAARVPSGAFAGRRAVDVQYEIYPDISPVIVGAPPNSAYEMALAVARAEGWTISRADPAALVFEAQDRSYWFGFIDDVAVRVRSNPPGAIVDVRSAARVRAHDGGANAARVRRFIARLKSDLAASS